MKTLLILISVSGNIASANTTNNEDSIFSSLLIFIGLFAIMYFVLIRPQTQKLKEHKTLINSLKINDEIIINNGILGKINKILDNYIIVSLNDNTEIIIKKDSISNALPKGTMKHIQS